MAHLRDRVPAATEFNPSVPDALSRIIYKVMSKEPSARYRMADQLGHILRSYQDGNRQSAPARPSVSEPSVSYPAPAPRPPSVPAAAPLPPVSQPAAPPPRPVNVPAAAPGPAGLPRQSDSRPFEMAAQRGDSARFYSQPRYTSGSATGLDVVTITLALLAFMAVFCLIPLYIVVFQVRFGG